MARANTICPFRVAPQNQVVMASYPEKFPKFHLPERVAINLLREFCLPGAFC